MKKLILGNGYVGNMLAEIMPSAVLSTSRINSIKDVLDDIAIHKPSVIINCIGRTGSPSIDWCEDNKEITLHTNFNVPLMINEACKMTGVTMVHIGTGCVYTGNASRPFKESSPANCAKSWYSKTKYWAERALDQDDILQLRIRMPISWHDSPRNLLNKLLSFDQIIDCPNSLTILDDFAAVANELINRGWRGIVNMCNDAPVHHSDILKIYNQYAKTPKKINIMTLSELKKIVKAPRSNCVLDMSVLRYLDGVSFTDTHKSLHRVIERYCNEHNV